MLVVFFHISRASSAGAGLVEKHRDTKKWRRTGRPFIWLLLFWPRERK